MKNEIFERVKKALSQRYTETSTSKQSTPKLIRKIRKKVKIAGAYPTSVIPSPVIAKTVSFSGSSGESAILAIRRSPLDFRRYTRV